MVASWLTRSFLHLIKRYFASVSRLPLIVRFVRERRAFIRSAGVVTKFYPIISDYHEDAGVSSGHYFHQDLLVASMIHRKNPRRHIDVGSRIDGFVAHVASYREIEIMDLRSLDSTGHSSIISIQTDLMQSDDSLRGIADSISCLHALEHFGLGRYGDRIDPNGHLVGFANLCEMVEPEGTLYISFPIGQKDEVHFNAHRVFHPLSLLSWPTGLSQMTLERFDYVDDSGGLHTQHALADFVPDVTFGCGIYTLKKLRGVES